MSTLAPYEDGRCETLSGVTLPKSSWRQPPNTGVKLHISIDRGKGSGVWKGIWAEAGQIGEANKDTFEFDKSLDVQCSEKRMQSHSFCKEAASESRSQTPSVLTLSDLQQTKATDENKIP